MTAREERHLTGRQVLVALLSFFAIMLLANGIMVWQALDSFSGQVAANPYVEGLAHNQALERAETEATAGWRIRYVVEDERRLVLSVRAGTSGIADIFASMDRPAQYEAARPLALTPSTPGRWRADLRAFGVGQWQLVIEVTDGDGRRIRRQARIILR